jgi:hypothetical protein
VYYLNLYILQLIAKGFDYKLSKQVKIYEKGEFFSLATHPDVFGALRASCTGGTGRSVLGQIVKFLRL